MQQLKSAAIAHGAVTYISAEPAVPDSSETKGKVTVNVVGRAEKPAYWNVYYSIHASFEGGGGPALGTIGWDVRLPVQSAADAKYSEVEAEAARQIAPMLRAVADAIEKQVAEADA
jgi:hypothetical protein